LKKNDNENIYLNPKSTGIQQIIGRVPSWIIRWGISLVFLALIMALSLCWFIEYPVTIKVPFEVKSIIGPCRVINPRSGKLEKILVANNSKVKNKQPILYIGSNANLGEVLKLSDYINSLRLNPNGLFKKSIQLKPFNMLGELQFGYDSLKEEIVKSYSHPRNYNHIFKKIDNYKSSIDTWEKKHLIIAPISGQLLLTGVFEKGQRLDKEESLFIIVPDNLKKIGLLLVPKTNITKIKRNQKVLIKIDNFPISRCGSILSYVLDASQAPLNDSTVLVSVKIDSVMRTTAGCKMKLIYDFKGSADVIISKGNLIKKILDY